MSRSDRLSILVVCTANQCRSPLAAAALQARLDSRAVPAVVTSVGTNAVGAPATPPTVDAARRLGIELDISDHTSRRLAAADLASADLVVTMERNHLREAVVLNPGVFPRTFTLKELVRRAEAIGPRSVDESLSSWFARVNLGRRASDLLGDSRDDDVDDPTVSTMTDHDTMAREVLDLVDRIVPLAWP